VPEGVAVVDAQRVRRLLLADGAGIVLRLAHALVVLAIEAIFAHALLPALLLAKRRIVAVFRAPLGAERLGMGNAPGAIVGKLAGAKLRILGIAPAMLFVGESHDVSE